jgi:hypothetical protein
MMKKVYIIQKINQEIQFEFFQARREREKKRSEMDPLKKIEKCFQFQKSRVDHFQKICQKNLN